ncbi:MAG: Asp-tRNA(Asn)/Glu-tRNA(Gln) amidotransferase subunit GatC [Bacteroidota bacterium]
MSTDPARDDRARIDRAEVQRLARLARLQFTEEEEARMADDLSQILAYVEQLQAIDTEGVPPMAHGFAESDEALAARLRPDVIAPRITRDEALANAPDTDGTFVRVPKVIE